MTSPRRCASFALVLFVLFAPVSGAFAQDFFEDLFGGGESYRSAPPRARGHARDATSGQFRDSGRRRREMRDAQRNEAWRAAGQNGSAGDASGSELGAAAGGEFCVRTCDGYFFPLIRSARATRQDSCAFACPSATVEYYRGGSIESARNLRGQRYTDLPNAFKYREQAIPGCACHPPAQAQQTSLRIARKDPTAQAGDIVVGEAGAFVFNGRRIIPLEGSHEVSAAIRRDVKRMTDGPGKVAYGVVATPRPVAAAELNVGHGATPAAATAATPQNDEAPLAAATPALSVAAGVDGNASGGGGATILFAILAALAAAFALTKRRGRALIHAARIEHASLAAKPAADNAARMVDDDPPLAWVWSAYRGEAPGEENENRQQALTSGARQEEPRNEPLRLSGTQQAAAA